MKTKHIRKSHNKTLLIYHIVCPAKYRRRVFTKEVSKTLKEIKSITARYIFKHHPEVKTMLWGGNFWTSGYYANTVGQFGNLDMIINYVKNQDLPKYQQVHVAQLTLFDN